MSGAGLTDNAVKARIAAARSTDAVKARIAAARSTDAVKARIAAARSTDAVKTRVPAMPRRDTYAILMGVVQSFSSGTNTRDMHVEARHVQSLVALEAAALMAAAVRLSARAVAWREEDIDRWINARVQTGAQR